MHNPMKHFVAPADNRHASRVWQRAFFDFKHTAAAKGMNAVAMRQAATKAADDAWDAVVND